MFELIPPAIYLLAGALLLAAIFYGDRFAAAYPFLAEISVGAWVWILLVYSFVASVLPVWLLLQPREIISLPR